MEEAPKNTGILHSLENAFRLLDLFGEAEELSVTQIARDLSVAKSTVVRMLNTLGKWGYTYRNPETGKYRLGFKFSYFGALVLNRQEIVRLARPYLARLTREFNETSHLAILEEGGNIRFIEKIMGTQTMSMTSTVGAAHPAYCTANGKVLLAYLPPERVQAMTDSMTFREHTGNTIKSRKQLLEELESIRRQGYAVDNEESEVGLTCFAVPLMDVGGQALAGISLSGPTGRMVPRKAAIVASLKETSAMITRDLK